MTPKRRPSAATERALADVAAGLSQKAAAKRHGLAVSTVWRACQRPYVLDLPQGNALTEEALIAALGKAKEELYRLKPATDQKVLDLIDAVWIKATKENAWN